MSERGMTPARTKTATITEQMDWSDACRAIGVGKRVTRAEWGDPGVSVFLHAEVLHLRKADGVLHVLRVQEGDLSATDWVLADQTAAFTLPPTTH